MHAIELGDSPVGQAAPMGWTQVDMPKPGVGQVLIEVTAAALNRADVLQRRGLYPPPTGSSPILGLECSGTIAEVGGGVSPGLVGTSACALVEGGGYAEFCLADSDFLLPLETSAQEIAAAAMPEVLATCWLNLFWRGTARTGDWLLVQGGSGGIGTTAIQIAKRVGCKVIATASTREKRELCLALGADHALDYQSHDFVDQVLDLTRGVGVDAVLDNVGPSNLDLYAQMISTYGNIVMIGSQGGRAGSFNLGPLMAKQIHIHATSLRRTPRMQKVALFQDIRRRAWPMVEDGSIQPVVDSVFQLPQAACAHKRLEDPHHAGKILLTAGIYDPFPEKGIHRMSPVLQRSSI